MREGFCLSSTKDYRSSESFTCLLLEHAGFQLQLLSCFPSLCHTLTLLTHFGLCVVSLCAEVRQSVP